MKVIVLLGLVSIEKITLTAQLSAYFAEQLGLSVTIVDNIARMAINSEQVNVPLRRVLGDGVAQLTQVIPTILSDVVLWAMSETAHPEAVVVALDQLHETFPHLDMQTLALVDLRTCDCFPHVREALEMYADCTYLIPYELEKVINDVTIHSVG